MTLLFIRYLLNRNYKPDKITVISMYKGQELCIKRHMKQNKEFNGVRIVSIDNFQGRWVYCSVLQETFSRFS